MSCPDNVVGMRTAEFPPNDLVETRVSFDLPVLFSVGSPALIGCVTDLVKVPRAMFYLHTEYEVCSIAKSKYEDYSLDLLKTLKGTKRSEPSKLLSKCGLLTHNVLGVDP